MYAFLVYLESSQQVANSTLFQTESKLFLLSGTNVIELRLE